MQSENFIYHNGRITKKCKPKELDVIKNALAELLKREPRNEDYSYVVGVYSDTVINGYFLYFENVKIGKVMGINTEDVRFVPNP